MATRRERQKEMKAFIDRQLADVPEAQRGLARTVMEASVAQATLADDVDDVKLSAILADVHYQDSQAASTVALALMKQYKTDCKSDKYMPFFVMVGATSSTGDSLGPFVGWFLKRRGFRGEWLGDLSEPVCASNIREKVNETWHRTMRQGKFPYIIAIDAAIGRPGRVTVSKGALKPGAGMGKNLPELGSVHIMGGTAHFPFMVWFTELDQTVAMAEVIADGLIQFYDEWLAGSASVSAAEIKWG